MAKNKRVMKDIKSVGHIVIESETNDDWIKSLASYKGELEIHEKIAEQYGREPKEKEPK